MRLMSLRRCLSVTGFTNPPIGEALVTDGSEQHFGAFGIAHTERGAAVVTEVEFRQVAVEVSLAAMLIDADHAAFEHREHVLDSV